MAQVAYAAVCSKAVVLLLLIYICMCLPLIVRGVLCLSLFGMHYFMSILVLHLDREARAGCFTFIVFYMSCYNTCSMALPHGAVGCFAVYDCGIP